MKVGDRQAYLQWILRVEEIPATYYLGKKAKLLTDACCWIFMSSSISQRCRSGLDP
ncbi:hypothetical protein HanIR_Chr01g0007481 [Helianthus annuus]|nr:hypothetical protein HanIR_Chr01g0007481 [Helianthus annuus]